jgi:hypothetical protein
LNRYGAQESRLRSFGACLASETLTVSVIAAAIFGVVPMGANERVPMLLASAKQWWSTQMTTSKHEQVPQPNRAGPNQTGQEGKVRGEGDYEATRRYRKEVSDFVAQHDVAEVAKRAKAKSAEEARNLAIAEEQGRARSKGDDPADVGEMYPGRKVDTDR